VSKLRLVPLIGPRRLLAIFLAMVLSVGVNGVGHALTDGTYFGPQYAGGLVPECARRSEGTVFNGAYGLNYWQATNSARWATSTSGPSSCSNAFTAAPYRLGSVIASYKIVNGGAQFCAASTTQSGGTMWRWNTYASSTWVVAALVNCGPGMYAYYASYKYRPGNWPTTPEETTHIDTTASIISYVWFP
jgi:hypothetical protein